MASQLSEAQDALVSFVRSLSRDQVACLAIAITDDAESAVFTDEDQEVMLRLLMLVSRLQRAEE
jgi:hypothetical protein